MTPTFKKKTTNNISATASPGNLLGMANTERHTERPSRRGGLAITTEATTALQRLRDAVDDEHRVGRCRWIESKSALEELSRLGLVAWLGDYCYHVDYSVEVEASTGRLVGFRSRRNEPLTDYEMGAVHWMRENARGPGKVGPGHAFVEVGDVDDPMEHCDELTFQVLRDKGACYAYRGSTYVEATVPLATWGSAAERLAWARNAVRTREPLEHEAWKLLAAFRDAANEPGRGRVATPLVGTRPCPPPHQVLPTLEGAPGYFFELLAYRAMVRLHLLEYDKGGWYVDYTRQVGDVAEEVS